MLKPMPFLVMLGLAGLGSTACGQADAPPPTPPDIQDVFEEILLPPDPVFVSRSGSSDALQIVLRSPASRDEVLAYYREALQRGRWQVVSDRPDAAGVQVLYAERNGRPMWIRVAAEGQSSRVELAGAVVRQPAEVIVTPPPDSLELSSDSTSAAADTAS